MYKFKRDMQQMNGKAFRAGMDVPDGFSTPKGLAEMVRTGDIEEVGSNMATPMEDEVPVMSEEMPTEPVPESIVTPKKPRKTKGE